MPMVPNSPARQLASDASLAVNPIEPRRAVPNNVIAIIPLKLTVQFRRTERNNARRAALKYNNYFVFDLYARQTCVVH